MVVTEGSSGFGWGDRLGGRNRPGCSRRRLLADRWPFPAWRRSGRFDRRSGRTGLAASTSWDDNHAMTIIKINAITVPEGAGDEVARRFAERAGAVDNQEGFEGFELLRPTDDRTTWLVVTRWRDEASFAAWVGSPAFAHGHAAASGGDAGGSRGGPPMGLVAELWSYEPVVGSDAAG